VSRTETRVKTRTIAVTNQKGGVAKTTTVASLGAALAERGERVVLVDLDPQACLTFSLGIDPEEVELSVNEALLGKADLVDTVIPLGERLDLVPSTIELAGAEAALLTRTGRELAVRNLLDGLHDDVDEPYGWVLLDCPPTLGVLTVNALTAAREVMVPLQCETLSHRGVGQLLDTVHDVRRLLNPRLRLLGVLPTLFDARTNHARAVLADISDRYGLPVLQPAIPKSVRFAEAPAVGRTVLETARSSRGAEAYRELARRLLDGSATRTPTAP
jgi:chromosome partitioning protein